MVACDSGEDLKKLATESGKAEKSAVVSLSVKRLATITARGSTRQHEKRGQHRSHLPCARKLQVLEKRESLLRGHWWGTSPATVGRVATDLKSTSCVAVWCCVVEQTYVDYVHTTIRLTDLHQLEL